MPASVVRVTVRMLPDIRCPAEPSVIAPLASVAAAWGRRGPFFKGERMQQRLLVPEDYRRSRPRGDLFFKLATAYLRSQLGKTSLERAARQLFNSDDALLVTRAAVSPATTTTTGWAAELAGQMVWDVCRASRRCPPPLA
jgi:hypothetical protein